MSLRLMRAGRVSRRGERARRLRFESLEARTLLDGVPLVNINFQLASAPVPAGYLADDGSVFADRGNGWDYGWNIDHTDVSRDRNVHPDQRLDTLLHFHAGGIWEIEVPNGVYEVTVSIGDASNPSTHTLNVEGTNYWNAVPLTANQFLLATQTVTVSDGRLTIDQGAAVDKATRINYVEIVTPEDPNNTAPATPTITEPGTEGQIVNPADVHMEATGFSDPDGDAHFSTDWEIWRADMSERVWATLNIQGVERVHTHMGDGVFQGSHSGRTDLLSETDYVLRVRFRDDRGAVSDWATRSFTTGAQTQVFPLELEDVLSSPAPTWRTATGGANVVLPAGSPAAALQLDNGHGDLLLRIEGFNGTTNQVTNPAALAEHAHVRVVISGGSTGVSLAETDLQFTEDDGSTVTIYLPSLTVAAGQQRVFWVAADGATFLGNASQTEPDFSSLARSAPVPFVALQPGYRVDVVATGFQLPVNIAFVPNPGSDPDDPLYYVTELYGNIKVVTNSGNVSNYATGLLNFNPTGAFPGSGEQGLTGLVVDPLTGDLFAALLYTSVPGNDGAPHWPKVIRLHSTDGGLTASTITTVLDMPGETMGQSHQISNLSIGPDGKLYVHMGDGFDAATAQNLNSFRGKILRLNLNGTAAIDNPFYNAADGITARDYVYAYGFRNAFGGAWRAADGFHYEVENGPSVDRLVKVERGVNYLWNGSDASMSNGARYLWNPAHAPVNIAFVQPTTFGGSGFPTAAQGHAYVSESGPTYATGPQAQGKRIVEFAFDANGNVTSGPVTLVEYAGTGKGTVVALAPGPDGLYFSDLYKDQDFVTPIDVGAKIYRVSYVGLVDFTADVTSGAPPLTVHFADQSDVPGASAYFWEFGDGTTSTQQNPTHIYSQEGTYDVRLTVTGDNGAVVNQKNGFIVASATPPPGLQAEYYDNINLTNLALTRTDTTVNFDWGTGSPAANMGVDTFSVRWQGYVKPEFTQTYTFYTETDDGVRLWVNDQLVIDRWIDQAPTEHSGTIALQAGVEYSIRMEFYENGGGAMARLSWSRPGQTKEIIPQDNLQTARTPHNVVGRHVFYNQSAFDGNNAANNTADDGAIAPSPAALQLAGKSPLLGKEALLPGQTATFANYTSYNRGINGVMIDVVNLPSGGAGIDASDFEFRTGNDNDPFGDVDGTPWALAQAPLTVSVRPHPTLANTHRITITWATNDLDAIVEPNEAVAKAWLQVIVKANADTGLTAQDVFYWGNAVGDSGNSTANTQVNATDELNARNNPHNVANPAPLEDFVDYNRDARVNATDQLIARNNVTNFTTDLNLVSVPSGPPASALAAVSASDAVFAASAPAAGSRSTSVVALPASRSSAPLSVGPAAMKQVAPKSIERAGVQLSTQPPPRVTAARLTEGFDAAHAQLSEAAQPLRGKQEFADDSLHGDLFGLPVIDNDRLRQKLRKRVSRGGVVS